MQLTGTRSANTLEYATPAPLKPSFSYIPSIGLITFRFISARCNIYISRLCYDVSVRLSGRLSVTEVHWRIIANLGFKFRSHFTAHCGRRAACGRIISRHASQCYALLLLLRITLCNKSTTYPIDGECIALLAFTVIGVRNSGPPYRRNCRPQLTVCKI